MHWLLLGVVFIIIFVGLAGTLIPGLPGAPLIFLGILLYAWSTGFNVIGGGWVVAFALLALAAVLLDYGAAALGARRFGASRAGVAGALIGAVLGTIWLGPLGLALGPFACALLAELLAGRSWREAAGSGLGSALGLLFSLAGQLAIAGLMVGLFLLKVF